MNADPSSTAADLLSQSESAPDLIAALKQRVEELAKEVDERRRAEVGLRKEVERHSRTEHQLSALVRVSAALTDTLDPSHVLASLLDFSQRLFPADAYAIWRLHARTGQWQIAAAANLSEEFQRGVVAVLEQSPGMPETPVVADDVFALPLLADRKAAYRAEGIRSLLAVPLRMHGQVRGTLAW
ncbi:MAG TPA: GAF domain-containing protein [Pirellulales bacterium]|nr:GAF domain-containing protein [Pirellulales bacterium]